jgi:hypothetical protein
MEMYNVESVEMYPTKMCPMETNHNGDVQNEAMEMYSMNTMSAPHMNTIPTTYFINDIISSGYGGMVRERLEEGWDGYLITFMFKSLRGSRDSVIRQMEKEVERVYAGVLKQLFRHPRRVPSLEIPLWIACPDYPVPKHAKKELRYVAVNSGLHFQGVAAMPHGTRLNCGLDEHFELFQDHYVRPSNPLGRVHAVPISCNPGYVTGYALKSIPRRRLDFDHVLILPRSHSEMPAESRGGPICKTGL